MGLTPVATSRSNTASCW